MKPSSKHAIGYVMGNERVGEATVHPLPKAKVQRRCELRKLILPAYVRAEAEKLSHLRNALADRLRLNAGRPSLTPDQRWNVTMAVSQAITESVARLERELDRAKEVRS